MNKVSVLIWAVDDDKVYLKALQLFLDKNGVDLKTFDKHEDFFSSLNSEVDIVLMDVYMPEFDIREGLKRMYSINNRILTILMTSCPDYKVINSLRNANAIFKFVEKGHLEENNNPVSYMGEVVDLNCFEAISIFIQEAKKKVLTYKAAVHE